MTARALIAEDEPLLAHALKAELAAAWPELAIVATVGDGPAALAAIEAERPAVVFLDIRMPGLTGLEVAAELADRGLGQAPAPLIVFVTAYDEYAIEAFRLAAFDYVLKPVDAARLAETVQRLRARLARPADDLAQLAARLGTLLGVQGIAAASAAAPAAATPALTTIRAATGNTVHMLPVAAVRLFQATDKYVSVITADAEHLIRTPLKELLAGLPAARFRQVHRGAIVNLDHVTAAERDEAGRLWLRVAGLKQKVAVSRVYAEQFRQM